MASTISLSCLLQTIILLLSNINSLVLSTSLSDRTSLLSFKDQIHNDPLGALRSWNDSLHYCKWNGVTCSLRHRHRVTALRLQSQELRGTLSPYIGNLSFLKSIDLGMNNFNGSVPQEVGRLFRLRALYLDNNSFIGPIPTNLTHCRNLRQISLAYNRFSGTIPVGITSLRMLNYLSLRANRLEGSFTSSIGNLSSLNLLNLGLNNFTGNIPDEICHIRSLKYLSLRFNNFTGKVPSCLYNLTKMIIFSLSDNQLEGEFPQDVGLTLSNLQQLSVARNNFNGFIPSSLPNASKLVILELGENHFTGEVPSNMGRLQRLRYLSLQSGQMGYTSKHDLSFINSLTNCSELETLSLAHNSFIGTMPKSIANLSTQIIFLSLGYNQMHGSIPSGIENLVNLSVLDLLYNHLTGELPKDIGMFSEMQKLHLGVNQFTGEIPYSFGNLTRLQDLKLLENSLHGPIPPSLENFQNLFVLDLSHNRFNGTITSQKFSPSAIDLDFSNNQLSGRIPEALGKCLGLTYLRMEGNSFDGEIPRSLSTLKGIKHLDLSRNKLSGQIPEYLAYFVLLSFLDLSDNELEGLVPKKGIFKNATAISIRGNGKLCGGVVELGLFPCINKENSSFPYEFIPVILLSMCLVLLLCSLLVCYKRRMPKSISLSPALQFHEHPRVSYAQILKATNNFSDNRLIGVGGHCSVYKGFLAERKIAVAVKVFNLSKRGASKSFLTECNALRNLRHRNLLKVITSCSSVDFQGNDFKALVFEYMPNGGLDEWLHPETDEQRELRNLNLIRRLNIAIDVSTALDHLHRHCQPAIVHCDLKPSNVLLDDDLTAHVADFGLAKILPVVSPRPAESQSGSLSVKGSIGYVAPEYGMGSNVSVQGDVYSYGILVLEMFTGKKPTDVMFQDGLNLHNFAKMNSPEQVMKILDPRMLFDDNEEATNIVLENQSERMVRLLQCLVSIIRLGVSCSTRRPEKRMDMGQVVSELLQIRDHYLGVSYRFANFVDIM